MKVHKRIGVLMYQTSTSKGQELVAQRMVRDFISMGHEAYLITSVYHDGVDVLSSESLANGKGYVYVEDPELGFPVIRVASYLTNWPRRRISFRDFMHVLERIVDEYRLNVLITHSTLWNGPEEVAKFVAWRRCMKELGGYADPIVFCHMSHFQEPTAKHYSLVERTFRIAWNRLSLSQILKTADLVLVVTPIEKGAKISMGADPRKCFLFPSGVNEELFLKFAAADVDGFLREHQIPKDSKLVSYLGTLEERKNPMIVLKIAELLKDRHDIHFAIAGRGDTGYAEKIKARAMQMPNVTYLGEVDDKEKALLVKSTFVNVLMSRVEALGLSQIEFMYMGVPVVTSGVGGQSWLVKDGREGIHTKGPDDAEGAADAIRGLADNEALWNRLSANAKEKARSMTSCKAIRELDEAITEKLVKESGLLNLPHETVLTLADAEKVVKTWSKGSWGVVATDRRLFIRHGRISRKITEIPYENVAYIEHTRNYPWKILLTGLLPMFAILLEPLWRLILKSDFIAVLEQLVNSVMTIIPQLSSPEMATAFIALVPYVTCTAIFLANARTGFNLRGLGTKPIYLPHKFRDTIAFIRSIQDKQLNTLQAENSEQARYKLEDDRSQFRKPKPPSGE